LLLKTIADMRVDPNYQGYAVAATNAFLKTFCVFWVKNIELPLTYSDQQYSLMTKLTAARVFNTAILLLFTCEKSSITGNYLYLNTEFVAKIQTTLQADITLSLGRLADGPLLLKRVFLSRLGKNCQEDLNKCFVTTKWDLAERYSDSIKTLFLCLFYVSILPTGLGYATFAFALAYLTDKKCILRTWDKPPELNFKMSMTARYILEWTLVAHLAITWYLYRMWPFVEIQTDMDKVYTPEQRFLVTIYGLGTLGAGCFFGAKQFGNLLVAFITGLVGEQRCAQNCIVRCISCLQPVEQKFHLDRYSQLPGYGLAAFNPHPVSETAADFESFHVLNAAQDDGTKRTKILAPKIVAFMKKTVAEELIPKDKGEGEAEATGGEAEATGGKPTGLENFRPGNAGAETTDTGLDNFRPGNKGAETTDVVAAKEGAPATAL